MPGVRTYLSKIDDYATYLNDKWKLHITDRDNSAKTVISTFAGVGGSSLGYSMAGYKELLAVEWDDDAVKTFKLNFQDIPIYHGDIAKLSVEKVFEITGLERYELDILDGSPPCQGFSMAGKRKLEDGRNQLFREYVRLLDGLQPKILVMENVSGMVRGKMKLIFVEILKQLIDCGYDVEARLMNTMYFGVPQARQRLIFIGVRKDLVNKVSHPKPKFMPISVGQAWKSMENTNDNKDVSDKMKRFMQIVPQGKSLGTIHPKGSYFNYVKLQINKPSNTITKGANRQLFHPIENRTLTSIELSRLGSFPDEFIFTGIDNCSKGIGNSVPPLFMYEIAKHIKSRIL